MEPHAFRAYQLICVLPYARHQRAVLAKGARDQIARVAEVSLHVQLLLSLARAYDASLPEEHRMAWLYRFDPFVRQAVQADMLRDARDLESMAGRMDDDAQALLSLEEARLCRAACGREVPRN